MSKKIVCSSYIVENSKLREESYGSKDELNEIMEIAVMDANPSMDIPNLTSAQVAQMESNLKNRVTVGAIKLKNARAASVERS